MKIPPQIYHQKHTFTLVEVVIALAILAISLSVYFSMTQSAQKRLDRARKSYEQFHLLTQAAEYYLLFASEEPPEIPVEIFDETEYGISAYYIDAEGLDDDLNFLTGQAPLRTLVIELIHYPGGETVDTLKIDRIDYSQAESSGETL